MLPFQMITLDLAPYLLLKSAQTNITTCSLAQKRDIRCEFLYGASDNTSQKSLFVQIHMSLNSHSLTCTAITRGMSNKGMIRKLGTLWLIENK
jgi:hypothetical protein